MHQKQSNKIHVFDLTNLIPLLELKAPLINGNKKRKKAPLNPRHLSRRICSERRETNTPGYCVDSNGCTELEPGGTRMKKIAVGILVVIVAALLTAALAVAQNPAPPAAGPVPPAIPTAAH